MIYEMLIFLFVAVVLAYLTLVGVLLRRELAAIAREDLTKNQLPCRTTYDITNEWIVEQLWQHLRKIYPSQQADHGPLDSAEYSELEEQVRSHFYRLLPTLETEHEPEG